jgi:hypothetical protein
MGIKDTLSMQQIIHERYIHLSTAKIATLLIMVVAIIAVLR